MNSGHKKTKRKTKTKARIVMQASMNGIDTSKLSRRSDILSGHLIWVVEGGAGQPKSALETAAFENGADICQGTPQDLDDGASIRLTIGGRVNSPSSASARKAGLFVLSPAWLLDSIETGSPLIYDGEGAVAEYVILSPYENPADDEEELQPAPKRQRTGTSSDRKTTATVKTIEVDDESATEDDEPDRIQQAEFEAAVQQNDFLAGSTSNVDAISKSVRRIDLSDGETTEDDEEQSDDPPPPQNGDVVRTPFNRATSSAPGMTGEGVDPAHLADPATYYYAPRVFYLDTLENATSLGQSTDEASSVDSSFWTPIVTELEEHGGRITTNIDDPALTHLIIKYGETSRVAKLQARVSGKGRARRFVTHDWVYACQEDEALVEEEGFVPLIRR